MTGLLHVPVLVSLGAFLIALSARFAYMTGGHSVYVWVTPSGDGFIDGLEGLWVGVLHWLVPLTVLSFVKRKLEDIRAARTLIIRIEETRAMYAYFTVGFYIFIFATYPLFLSDLFLLPVIYVAFPAVAYSNLLRPTKRPVPAFPLTTPSTGSEASRMTPSFVFWIRVVTVCVSFVAAGVWAALELQAPWWPRGPLLTTLEAITALVGTAGFAILVAMLLLQTPAETRTIPGQGRNPYRRAFVRRPR